MYMYTNVEMNYTRPASPVPADHRTSIDGSIDSLGHPNKFTKVNNLTIIMDEAEWPTIHTTEMHCSGEPLRIVESGYPDIQGEAILEKRRYCKEKLDHLRKQLMWEPRGHYDMYGAIKVQPDHPDADLAVLFMHNEGYSTMCGHAIMCLGRYVVDRGLQKSELKIPVTPVNIQCPCGLVKALVECDESKTNMVHFQSVPAFAFALGKYIFFLPIKIYLQYSIFVLA